MKRFSSVLALSAIASLTACGGGSGSSALPTAPKSPTQMQDVQFRITIPQSVRLSPKYISSSTQSASISVAPTGGAPLTPVNINCTTSCSGTISAPVGSDVFDVKLYDATNATGNVLSHGNATQTIVAGTANTVNLTFGGVVKTIALGSTASTVSAVTPVQIIVVGYDAAGKQIVGTANYDNPITLVNADTSGTTSLSTTNVTSPSTVVTLSYNGGSSSVGSVQITGGAAGAASGSVSVVKSGGPAAGPAAFMTQTSSIKVNGTVRAGQTNGIIAAISETTDQTSNGQNGTMPFGSLTVGSGSSAQSLTRAAQSISHAAVSEGWGPSMTERDGPDKTREMRAILSRIPRVAGTNANVRHAQSSVIPGSLVPGSTTTSIWVSTGSIGSSGGGYTALPATLEMQTPHGNIWIDSSLLPGGSLPSASFASGSLSSTMTAIGNDFENAYTSDTTHFASPDYPNTAPGMSVQFGDYDPSGAYLGTRENQYINEPADKRINVLVVNSANLGNGVGGYFASVNYVPQAILNYFASVGQTVPKSNEAPIMFVGWVDRNGATYELNEDLVRGMAHELQHLINFVNHGILAAAASTPNCSACDEDSGINEGLSMLSQDFAVSNLNPGVPFDVADAMSHAKQFLKTPQNYSVTGFIGIDPSSWGGDGVTPKYNCGGGCYGSAYLFQRYLRDRFGGDTYTRGMETSGITGYSNLAANAGGETAQNLLGDFAMAMGVNSQGLATTGAFNFGALNLVSSYTDQFGNVRTLAGAASTPLGVNSALNLTPPYGGFAFVSLMSIPAGGEPVSVVDATAGTNPFGLVGGLVQH